MFKWLTKLFMKDKAEGNETSDMEFKADQVIGDAAAVSSNDKAQAALKKRKHKLEIQLYEADYTDVPDGAPPKWRPVNMGRDAGKPIIVEVADRNELAELQQRYAMCDQKMKIIREIDPFVDEQHTASRAIPQNNQAIPVGNALPAPSQPQLAAEHSAKQAQMQAAKPKLKIVTIGDMQVKYDGDKVYQKQWVKLNANEAANFRIVNDSSNKIVALNGKHIECKKWVIVEEDAAEDADDVMSTISGE